MLLSPNDNIIESGTGYVVTSDFFDELSQNYTYTIQDVINTFKASADFLIDGRFIDHSHISEREELRPRYSNDVEQGKCQALNIKLRFIEEWESKTHYEIYLFSGGVPRAVEFNGHIIKQFEGNKFYVDDVNENVFVGHVHNTKEVALYRLLLDYFNRFGEGDHEYKLVQKLKEVDPEKLRKDKSNSKYYKSKVKSLVKNSKKFTGDWLRNILLWEKAKKEEVYYQNKKLRFNKVSVNSESELILNEYQYDTIPSFLEAYDKIEEVILYSNEGLVTFEANLQSADDFEICLGVNDENKIQEIIALTSHAETKAIIKLGDEDPWLKKLDAKLFQEYLVEDEDKLDIRITEEWTSEDLSFIFGPPGTGKTTKSVLYALYDLAQAAAANQEARILLLTPTNKAADVFIEKALQFLNQPDTVYSLDIGLSEEEQTTLYEFLISNRHSPSFLYRFGNSYSENIPPSQVGQMLPSSEQSLVATTIHRYVHNQPIYEYNQIDQGASKLILDEASMISLPHIIYALLTITAFNDSELKSSKLTPVTIAGDPFQLKPVGLTPNPLESRGYNGWSTESIYTLLKLEQFDLDSTPVGGYTIDNLKIQYRSSTSIGRLYSDYCYEGLLHHFHDELPSDLNPEFPESIYRIEFEVHSHKADEHPLTKLYTYRKYSTYHLYSCILAIELAAKIRSISDESVLLLSPYGIQARILRDIIEKDKYRFTDDKVSAGTVHSSQGDEADHVILVQNPSELTNSHMAFFNNRNIINVAISRAKKKLFVLLPNPVVMAKSSSNELYDRVLTDEHPVSSYRCYEFEQENLENDHTVKSLLGVQHYSDFIVENLSNVTATNKKYQFYVGDGKVFSWFNPKIEKTLSDAVILDKNLKN